MSPLDRLTTSHGRLSDLKLIWWPFLFLKPESAGTPITWRRLLLMIPCFSAWILVGWLLRELLVGNLGSLRLADLARVYGILLIIFTLWFNLVTAPLWNRRARSLSESCN